MIRIPDVKNKSIGVYGLGVSGMAAAEALVASGANVFTWDENKDARNKTRGSEYLAEHPKQWPWDELSAVVVSPGVPLTHPKPHAIVRKARSTNVPVYGDTELFARAVNAMPENARPKIVAITGSNGKTTTTALIGKILVDAGEDAHVGGNIGEAVLSLPPPEKDSIYVLELSSFQLDLTFSLRANVAILLNISPDHIERHGTMDGYLAAKTRIFHNQQVDDIAIVGTDDEMLENVATKMRISHPAKFAPISVGSTLGEGAFVLDGQLFHNLEGKTLTAGDISNFSGLRGQHNHQNVAAAMAASVFLGVSPAIAMRAAEKFEALPNRMETVAKIGKVLFVNDSKATNASAAARALSAFKDVFWIAGGKPKDGGVSSLTNDLKNVRSAYLIGEAASDFEQQLRNAAHCILCETLDVAVARAYEDALNSDAEDPVVLLSPACASYDQFKNFSERGAAFRRLADQLPRQNGEAA